MSEEKLLDSTLIDDINGLSVRATNCLHNEGIRTVGAVRAMTDPYLLRIPHFGRRTLREVRRIIGEYDPAAVLVLRGQERSEPAPSTIPVSARMNGDMPRAERNCANCDHSRLAGRELRCWSQPPTPCTIGFQPALEGALPRPIIVGVLPPTFPWYCCPKWEHMAADHPDFGVKELVSEVDTMVSTAETRQ